MNSLGTLDHAVLHATAWSAELVRARLVEAYEIEARVPDGSGPRRGSGTSWPAMAREFTDLVGWSDEARAAWWSDAARAKGVFAFEMTRMEEAQAWLAWLKNYPDEYMALRAYAMTRAARRSLARVMRAGGWPKQTFYRQLNQGSARIADRLNKESVVVR